MSTELKMLAWSICLGIAYVLVAAALSTAQRGFNWNVGNRDAPAPRLGGAAARAHRASRNFLETFVFFAAAVLAVQLAQKSSPHSALGAQQYFWGRAAYLPIYIIGIPYLRTLAWVLAFWGMLQVIGALF
jgi:uncharacterized MAPEG superfamily protein